MSNYVVFPEQHELAKFFGVTLKSSSQKRKKIDVFKNDELLCSIGAINFEDMYQMRARGEDKEIINEKKEKYRRRHQYKNSEEAYFSIRLLW